MANWIGTTGDDGYATHDDHVSIYGLDGNDVLTAYGQANRLYGGAGNDVLSTGAARVVSGGDGDDRISLDSDSSDHFTTVDGGAGFDVLTRWPSLDGVMKLQSISGIEWLKGTVRESSGGSKTFSHVEGSADDNVFDFSHTLITDVSRISGGEGDDVVIGSNGRDTLAFSAGSDTLTGGRGNDVFLMEHVSDSSPASGSHDTIADFRSHKDRIDLSWIDADGHTQENQAFAFIGTDRFSGHCGELRYEVVNGDTHVLGDINGDHQADIAFTLTGVHALTSSDFVL